MKTIFSSNLKTKWCFSEIVQTQFCFDIILFYAVESSEIETESKN